MTEPDYWMPGEKRCHDLMAEIQTLISEGTAPFFEMKSVVFQSLRFANEELPANFEHLLAHQKKRFALHSDIGPVGSAALAEARKGMRQHPHRHVLSDRLAQIMQLNLDLAGNEKPRHWEFEYVSSDYIAQALRIGVDHKLLIADLRRRLSAFIID